MGLTGGDMLDLDMAQQLAPEDDINEQNVHVRRLTRLAHMNRRGVWGGDPELVAASFIEETPTSIEVYRRNTSPDVLGKVNDGLQPGVTPLMEQPHMHEVAIFNADYAAEHPTEIPIYLQWNGVIAPDGSEHAHYSCLIPASIYWIIRAVRREDLVGAKPNNTF
jgi:hypothetical protein